LRPFLCLWLPTNPQESAVVITSVLDWVNSNPELTSGIVIGLALFGLAPAILTALGATALVYALLSVGALRWKRGARRRATLRQCDIRCASTICLRCPRIIPGLGSDIDSSASYELTPEVLAQ
jgi:hypothetical protein